MMYIILESDATHKLQSEVLDYLGRGWKLQGGVSIAVVGFTTLYAQAMVKE